MIADKILNDGDAGQFLHKIGLTIGEDVVVKVLDILTEKSSTSFYELYSSKPRRNGTPRIPLCGKGTVGKIKKLFNNGVLQPYIQYLEEGSRRKEEFEQYNGQPATASTVANDMAPLDAQLIKQQQKAHIKTLQQMARSALDHLPDFPDPQSEPEAFDSFNDAVVKVYRRLTGDIDDWKSMAQHLGDKGNDIEKMSFALDDVLPWGSLIEPMPQWYKDRLEEAWLLLKIGGLKTISESTDTRKWEWEGLNQRCQHCPEQKYEPMDMHPY